MIRSIDLLLSLAGILIASPVLLSVFLIGLFESGSPFFLQSRVGRHQQTFTLIKFRTMRPGTRSLGTHLVDPSAITRLGSFLRKTKLDELPQLFNVLLGQMSLVGPRPCLPNQTELIAERAARDVFVLRPGITGLAQIYDVDMSTPRKLARYDRIMVERLDLGLYLRIIFATASGRGRGDRVRAG
ncbi:MAG: sugar transferase [Gammaproteobacteria bacterium]|jgi:lipopolysaccharide/colanic/teichoic acid biosynthesis glycosyltransferase